MHEAFATELAGYELSKGTIRFPLDAPVPADLIARIAQRRASEDAERKRVLAEAAKARRAMKSPPV